MGGFSEFIGIGGQTLATHVTGNPDDPAILLLQHPDRSLTFWDDLSAALVRTGRYVIRLSGFSGQGKLEQRRSTDIRDNLRAILGQLHARPALIAVGLDAPDALIAALGDVAPLISGSIIIDPQFPDRLSFPQSASFLPLLAVYGAFRPAEATAPAFLSEAFVSAEAISIDTKAAEAESLDVLSAVITDFLERKLPRAAPEYKFGSDARTLRDALGCFATGVTVLTTRAADGSPVGLTANSFTSVSLDPPLLLACIARSAGSANIFKTAQSFAVNVLHIGQQPTSTRFARKDEDRFGATPWEEGLSGIPVLTGSLATFECSQHAVHEGGDHIILVGQVERARFEPQRDPLLFFRGKYRRLHFV